ncbi:MAG TPA: acyl-CoA dehydrogenase [Steroidobacteraceae bacterium]|jgi:alkylation response protein AidB-like acyl-CoA dehydrogenase|nr:acyl-CoA dehydrogenase [Steroidobacteraceae bacterium]
MKLGIPEDSLAVKETFERFFAAESTSARVRAAEPVGFDPKLWRSLVELDVPFLRLSEQAGGTGMSLFDACLIMEQAGRRLASAPLAESIVTLRLLGEVSADLAKKWSDKVRGGDTILTLALQPVHKGASQLVPGGACAQAIVTFDGNELAIESPLEALKAPATLGGAALGVLEPGSGTREVIATGEGASRIWAAAVEEWKVLVSAALVGLSLEVLSMAAAYACERTAFDKPIGTYQGISHPLADDVIDADGAQMYVWYTLRTLADGRKDAAANISTLFWWAVRTATSAVKHSVHTFGGYGLTLEYDLQLYHRRAKAWPLALGDPQLELVRAGRSLFLGEPWALPNPGEVPVDFNPPEGGEQLAAETRTVFKSIIDPKKHKLHDHSFESHDWDVHRTLGKARLLYPDWPSKWGGRDADADSLRASLGVWQEVGYTPPPRSVTSMVGSMVQKFGKPELQEEVLARFGSGEITACLGYTEPSGGSDVFAAKTRAVRDGEGWVINGQKMFTSGAEWASYVLLVTRSNPDVPKHKGITLFLVPLKTQGVEIKPVYTFMDERTNATFYSDVRIPDRYRLGEIDGGAKVLSSALSQEQSGGYYHIYLRQMVAAAADWARRTQRHGRPAIEDATVLERLARVSARANIAEALALKPLGMRLAGQQDLAFGPAAKVFSTEAFITDSADLLDLTAPDSLLRGAKGLGSIEMGYRHSAATTIYGGASEVLRSMVAERRLGMPRSR